MKKPQDIPDVRFYAVVEDLITTEWDVVCRDYSSARARRMLARWIEDHPLIERQRAFVVEIVVTPTLPVPPKPKSVDE